MLRWRSRELGTRTLAPGIYKSAPGSFGITLGDLTLDAKGDPNALWVFQMATTLTVGTPATQRTVFLVNGAQAKNVYWQVGTAATINGIVGGGTMQERSSLRPESRFLQPELPQ
jgi:hypothetical protein